MWKPKKPFQKSRFRDLQNLLNSVDEIKIKELAKEFNFSTNEMKSWLIELLDDGIIKGEISGSKFIPLEKVDYVQLDEYQPRRGYQCAICFQPIDIQEPSFCPACSSFPHKDCILEYAEKYRRCPVCSEVLRWI